MKTRDVDVILKELKSKGYLFSADILKPEDLIESMVNLLRGNENVIDYIIDDYYIKAIYLITDSLLGKPLVLRFLAPAIFIKFSSSLTKS